VKATAGTITACGGGGAVVDSWAECTTAGGLGLERETEAGAMDESVVGHGTAGVPVATSASVSPGGGRGVVRGGEVARLSVVWCCGCNSGPPSTDTSCSKRARTDQQ
jgi:hypothetical protein